MTIQELGPSNAVLGAASTATRINTLSAFDFAAWAITFVAPGTPNDYASSGPETDGIALVAWCASQVGIAGEPDIEMMATGNDGSTEIDVATALLTRGAILLDVAMTKMCVCLGLNDIIDITNGMFFIRRIDLNLEGANWDSGYLLSGLVF